MSKLNYLWVRYGTSRTFRLLYILLALLALAIVSGAPSGGSGGGTIPEGWPPPP